MLNLTGVAAEVGVHTGVYSEDFLGKWHGGKYLMVDPWATQPLGLYMDRSNKNDSEFESVFEEAKSRVMKYKERVAIFRMTSEAAAALVEDDLLDFAFIDAKHDYFSVMSDMRAWWPKVRNGGILAGHDFLFDSVKFAALEFGRKMCVPVHRTMESEPSWYIVKP